MTTVFALGAAHLSERSLGWRWPLPGIAQQPGIELIGWFTPDEARARAGGEYLGIPWTADLDVAFEARPDAWLVLVPGPEQVGVLENLLLCDGDVALAPSMAMTGDRLEFFTTELARQRRRGVVLSPMQHAPWIADVEGLACYSTFGVSSPRLKFRHRLGDPASSGASSDLALLAPWTTPRLTDPVTLARLVLVNYLLAIRGIEELRVEIGPDQVVADVWNAHWSFEQTILLELSNSTSFRNWAWMDGASVVTGSLDPGPLPLLPQSVATWLGGDPGSLPSLESGVNVARAIDEALQRVAAA
jgi:hypothetical protein